MFLSRKAYDDLRMEWVKAHEEASALNKANAQLNAHIEWMRVRLTQLEFERAQLIQRYMGVVIPTPSFEQPAANAIDPNQTIDFQDIGDKEASRLGIGWNPDGTLKFENS